MSPNRFELIFKHIIGMTFTEYLVYLRVLKARGARLAYEIG
jgi:methylphosphotriester-DNA--protein-cysteine methyltransferase